MEFDYKKIKETISKLSESSDFEKIYAHVKWSRANSGCGKQETFHKRIKELKSELVEACEAFESGNKAHFAEELGDVLWDLMFLFVLCEEEGTSAEKIVNDRIAKQVRRCPHAYEPRDVSFPEELKIWKARKKLEKQGKLTGYGFEIKD